MSLEREMIDACCDPSCYHMQRNKAFRQAMNACIAEHLKEPQDECDRAYDLAIRHCVAAIERLMKHQVQVAPTSQSDHSDTATKHEGT